MCVCVRMCVCGYVYVSMRVCTYVCACKLLLSILCGYNNTLIIYNGIYMSFNNVTITV